MAYPRAAFVLALAPALLAALVLVRAAAFKLADRQRFADVVRAYRLLPEGAVSPLAAVLPFIELVLAVGLVVPPSRPIAALAAGALLLVFAAAMGVNLARGRREIDCGCGDPARSQPIGWGLVARNLVLAAMLGACAAAPAGRASLAGVAIALAAALGGLLLLLCQEAFAALPSPRAREGASA